jgi:type II secretory pathway component PulF
LSAVFALSLCFHLFLQHLFLESWGTFTFDLVGGAELPGATRLALPLLVHSWVFPLFFGLLLALVLLAFTVPALREMFRWRMPAFREAGLARIAGALSLLLDRAVPLPDAVALVGQLEGRSAANREMSTWQARLAEGRTHFAEVAGGGRVFPPLFVWLANNAGANLAEGFRRAAAIYRARAAARSEMMLHAALPVAVLTLGVLIVTQACMMLSCFLVFINLLDNIGG